MPDMATTMETKLPVRLRPSINPIDEDQLRTRPSAEPVNDQRPILRDPWTPASRDTERTPLPREPSTSSSGGNTPESSEVSPYRLDEISRHFEASKTPSPRSKAPSERREHEAQQGLENHGQQDHGLHQHPQQRSRTASLPAPQDQRHKPAPTPIMLPRVSTRLPSMSRVVGDVPGQHDRRRYPGPSSNIISSPAVNSPTGYNAFTPVPMYPVRFNYPFTVAHLPMPYLAGHSPFPTTHAQAHAQAQFAMQARAQMQAHGQMQTRVTADDRVIPQAAAAQATTQAGTIRKPRLELREDLWRLGPELLRNASSADVFVKAVDIRHSLSLNGPGVLSPISSTASPEPDQMQVDAPHHDQHDNPYGNDLHLLVLVHSPSHRPLQLRRYLERDKLRETIPDFAGSPRTPPLISPMAPSTPASAVTVSSAAALARRRKSHMRAQSLASPSTPTTPSSTGSTRSRFSMPPVPIHYPFARAHVPALAAVLHQGNVRRGDTIHLPMPFPGSWPDTVGYMYTGNEELLSERVRHNIWYLGGHPGHVAVEPIGADCRDLEEGEIEMATQ